MNTITIETLSSRTWDTLAARARAHAQSIEAEAAAILETALSGAAAERFDRLRFADEIAAMTPKGVVQDDSTAFIRAERDRER